MSAAPLSATTADSVDTGGKKKSSCCGSQYSSDPKYKKYVQQVEKCLNSFDNVHEWADCIAFLKQLLKAFQSYMQFKEIPRKLIVAKRLSQCLNPALPTGVHQRALDVYVHILTVLGSEGVKRDLALWSSGLFPFFEYAATSVKPTLLNIYETYYLPLQSGLRPIMKSFILALLPGLEEETGEFFEKVIGLLDRLAGTVSMSFFFQNLWLVMLTTPSGRGTSLNYLSRRLPQLNADEDMTPIVGQDIGLMIRAFAAALEDENLLVRRGALDILLQTMRVDSFTIRKAHADDRAILMRAATGVVLRRDLSLNRRLYTWLLGTDEKSENQIVYLKQNGLELLSSTLKYEMLSPSGDYSESRPFKIFISLLDKWEIGAPLTETLVYDAFEAIKQLCNNPIDGAEDLTMTASTLYEAVEPQIIWKHLLTAVFSEISGESTQVEAVPLVRFILQTFSQDEEIQQIHLPVIFAAIIDLLIICTERNPGMVSSEVTREITILLEEMLQHIQTIGLLQRPELSGDADAVAASQGPITPLSSMPSPLGTFIIPFASSFENLVSLSIACACRLETESRNVMDLRQLRCLCMEPFEWLSSVLDTLEYESARFTTVDQVISLVLSLYQNQYMRPGLVIDKRITMYKMTNKLLRYLRPDITAYHVRAVNLIWSLENSTTHSHVESILAQSMNSPESRNVQEAYEAFGTLWRLTGSMMIVLDTLKNDDPTLRRIGETWMRCSLKSYLRILDPILFELLDPTILRTSTTTKVRGRELQGLLYERPFDQHYINYILDLLLHIVRFGGQGFVKTARSSPIKRSHHPGLIQRVDAANLPDADITYLDVLIEILVKILQSEPKPACETTMGPLNGVLQGTAIELLQGIIARGDIDHVSVQSIEAVVIGKLYFSIHTRRLDPQNKLLHLLHSLISVRLDLPVPVNPLLIQTLIDGISVPSNQPVVQHWLDFILMAIPQFQPALQPVVTPLNDCICRQTLAALKDVLRISTITDMYGGDITATVTDADLIMLLNGLERLILLGLAYTSEASTSEEELPVVEKAESGGLLGYVSNVFGSDTTQANPEQLTARSQGYRSLDEGIRVLYSVFAASVWKSPPITASKDESLSLIFNRVRLRCRRVLEHLFRVQSAEVFESIVDCWSRNPPESIAGTSEDAAFELIDILLANAQNAVHMVCESISTRTSGISERSKGRAINPNLTDVILFKFLEKYMERLEGPLAIQVWGRYLQLVKEISGGTKEFKPQTFPALRCLSVLAEKVTQTTAMEDRRIRKELQDNYAKLLDSCVLFVGRTFDQGSWIRRSTKESLATNGRESPISRVDSKGEEKLESSSVSLGLDTPKAALSEAVTQIVSFVATSTLPNLRKFLVDNDKISTACSNIVYYIVNPALRGKTRPLDVDSTVIKIIQEMTRIPTALKAWRNAVIDLLNDNRLFNCMPSHAEEWKPIVKVLFDSDKTAFPELLGKVAGATSANIFTNREYEMLLRSLNVRRLSYVIFTGEKNHFITQLPTIQEKLVDILRNVSAPIVQSEVFLCIRVLLCRLSSHNLTSFWPHILTELVHFIFWSQYRIFEQVVMILPSDGSEDLQLVLAASKCLDLLLTLQTEEFQIHQWMFITDTVDAVYRPDEWTPEAMMDQLSEIVGSLPAGDDQPTAAPNNLVAFPDKRPMRRPFLNNTRQIDSIKDLAPFFSNISLSLYESVYASGGNIDWESVENGIMNDMFDGR
ncbi:Dopey, N-terminal-domain-containing protein [Cyathus striatus]|nr:Dopey, N-terminal-domain-containing protein [Cyathus striatus]